MTIIKLIFASFTFVEIQVSSFRNDDFPNQFHEINDQLLAVLDNVFIALKINKNFTKSEGIADYMSMHNVIQDAVEKNDKKYDNIIETTKTEIGNKTAYFILSINEFEDEMIRQQRFKYKTDLFNNTSDSSVLAEFINLGTGLNLKLNTLSNDLKFWESDISKTELTRRLYDGNLTVIRRFPFMASVHVDGRFNCAGSIIREDMVITAASCLAQFSRRFRATSIQVRVGSDYTGKEGQLVSVIDMWFHPLFNQTTLNHNLAILRLKRCLELQRRKLITVRFDTEAEDMPESAKGVMVLGWGDQCSDCEPSDTSHHLTKAFVHLYNLDDCMRIYSRTYVTPVSFCTGYNDKGSGACKNDIGGPAIVGSTLMGVISFGSPYCGRPQNPTVYTKLGYYADWINMVFDQAPINNTELEKNDIAKQSSNEIFGYSYKMSITEWFILKGIANDIQATRQRPVVQDFYGELEELDTFKAPKIYSDVKNHPLVDKSIVLDPNLVDIPAFSDESDIEGNLDLNIETDPPTPDAYKPFLKKDLNVDWEVYQSVVPKLVSLALTTQMTTTPPPPPEEPFVWPPHLLNLTADEDAYDQFTFDSTKLFLHKLTNPTPSVNENNKQPPNEVETGVQNDERENTPSKEAALSKKESEAKHLRLLQLKFKEASKSKKKNKGGTRKQKPGMFTRLYPI